MRTVLALLVLSLAPVLGGCAKSTPALDVATAQRDFSRESYCPIERVNASRILRIPAPPGVIASDEARLAMWRAAAESRAQMEPRKRIEVVGCGESAAYDCWDVGGRVPGRGGSSVWRSIGVACERWPAGVGVAPEGERSANP